MSTEFEPSGFFVVRAPLLSVELWRQWGECTDVASSRAFVRAQIERPEIREALAVASPSLVQGLAAWLRDPASEGGQKVERALVRYLARMMTRPTPFGLFAGCGVGKVADRTSIRVGSPTAHRRRTRLDNDFLGQLVGGLSQRPDIRAALRYRPNTSLYELGGRIRYVEARHGARGRTFHLVALDGNEFVHAAVERARHGATIDEIAAAIVEHDDEITIDEAREFVHGLVDSHIVVSELEPPVTGPEPLVGLCETLERLPGTESAGTTAHALREIDRELVALDAPDTLVGREARHFALADRLVAMCPTADPRNLMQVDMRLDLAEATLDVAVLPELVAAARLLARYCPEPDERMLRRFCQQFEERYERREVPLLEVLDEDSGIGFGKLRAEGNDPEPMLAGVAFPVSRGTPLGRTWGAFEEMLMHRLESMAPGDRELRLEATDFEGLPRREIDLPGACALDVTFAAADAEAMGRGDWRALLHLVDGPSGANWFGRFCHADPELHAWVERSLRQEEAQRPDAVFAEIVHLPEGRVGNVLLRPLLREYEIPYLGRSGADEDRQLRPDDLVVSVWDGRVVLKSKRLQKEVIPRLTSAHAFPNLNNIGVYRFLGALQTAGRSVRTSWNWGALDAKSTFLPRVTVGRVVLSLARWSLKYPHLAPLRATTREGRWDAMQALRETMHLPRFVALADADNLLCIDLDNPLSVESAAHLMRKAPVASLVEMFPEPDAAWVPGESGPLAHELLIPIARPAEPKTADAAAPWLAPSPPASTTRMFVPGSEWLYAKIYASPRSCDLALLRLAPAIRELLASGELVRWFFVRMSDETGWHLRLRMQGRPGRMPAEALVRVRAIIDEMIADRLVWKMQLDTYQREIEHWGGPDAVLLAEQFLGHDSDAALALLESYAEDPGELSLARWQLALVGIDGLWRGLGLDREARRELATACRNGLAREFQFDAWQEKQLHARYRAARADIDRVLGDDPSLPDGVAILHRRDEALEQVFAGFRELERTGRTNRPLAHLADRFSHLHVNRMMRSMLREQELLLMDFLARHHRSALARARKRVA